MTVIYSVEELKVKVFPIAKKYGVERVSLFGSYSRGEATADSDVDLIIEKGELRTLFQLIAFRQELEDVLHLSVDVVTTETSDQRFLQMIAKDGVVLYGAA